MNGLSLTQECMPCKVEESSYLDSITGNLNRRKLRAETELANVNAALAALQANPEVANIFELVNKANRG